MPFQVRLCCMSLGCNLSTPSGAIRYKMCNYGNISGRLETVAKCDVIYGRHDDNPLAPEMLITVNKLPILPTPLIRVDNGSKYPPTEKGKKRTILGP